MQPDHGVRTQSSRLPLRITPLAFPFPFGILPSPLASNGASIGIHSPLTSPLPFPYPSPHYGIYVPYPYKYSGNWQYHTKSRCPPPAARRYSGIFAPMLDFSDLRTLVRTGIFSIRFGPGFTEIQRTLAREPLDQSQ